MVYMVTFTINTPQMLAYIPYMDPMGDTICLHSKVSETWNVEEHKTNIECCH